MPLSPWASIFRGATTTPPSINNNGEAVFGAFFVAADGIKNFLATPAGSLYNFNMRPLPVSELIGARIADDGTIVARVNNGGQRKIVVMSYDLSTEVEIAGAQCSTLGGRPAISDDGQFVVFAGSCDIGVGGPGVFLSYRAVGGGLAFSPPVRIAGFSDKAELGGNVADATNLYFSDVAMDERVGLLHLPSGFPFEPPDKVVVTFVALPNAPSPGQFSNNLGIWSVSVELQPKMSLDREFPVQLGDELEVVPANLARVVQVGDNIEGAMVTGLTMHDPVSGPGVKIAFHAATTAGSRIVVGKQVISEVVDPNPKLLEEQEDQVRIISTSSQENINRLASQGAGKIGAVTDGATQLLLRVQTQDGGTPVEFQVEPPIPANGTLSTVGGTGTAARVTVTPVQTSDGRFFAFAIYTVPSEFGGPIGSSSRTINVRASTISSSLNVELPLTLERPPVVCIHGIWSDASACATLLSHLNQNGFRAWAADYKPYNGHSYSPNIHIDANGPVRSLVQRIAAIKEYYRGFRQIALTQVDVIAHSMGGLVTRSSTKVPGHEYREIDNFKLGDIRRLITVGTPHFGSQMSDYIFSERRCVADILSHATDPWDLHSGGFKALSPGSIEQFSLNVGVIRFEIPTHTISGTANGIQESATNGALQVKLKYEALRQERPDCVLTFFPGFRAIYGGDNDLNVSVVSQEAARFHSVFALENTNFPDHVHSIAYSQTNCGLVGLPPECSVSPFTAEMESGPVLDQITELFIGPASNFSPNPLPPNP